MRQPLAQWFKNQSPRFRFEKPVFPTAGRTLSALGHRRLNHNFVASGGFVRGRSSIGRARALQARGCRFEPDRLHCFCWCKTCLVVPTRCILTVCVGSLSIIPALPIVPRCASPCLVVPYSWRLLGGRLPVFGPSGARGRCRWPGAAARFRLLARPAGTVGLRWPKRDRSARGARRRWPPSRRRIAGELLGGRQRDPGPTGAAEIAVPVGVEVGEQAGSHSGGPENRIAGDWLSPPVLASLIHLARAAARSAPHHLAGLPPTAGVLERK